MNSADPTTPSPLATGTGMPGTVLQAIFGMGLSVCIGQSLNVYQAFHCEDGLDWHALLFSAFIVSGAAVVYLQMVSARVWARTAYLLLLVLSYSLMALDDSGWTRLDVISLCLTAPIDAFVVSRLFTGTSTHWLSV